jgi:hypothetical protein
LLFFHPQGRDEKITKIFYLKLLRREFAYPGYVPVLKFSFTE